jgi:uncharacterized protein (DUF2141 family)
MITTNQALSAIFAVSLLSSCATVSNVSVNKTTGDNTKISIDINGVSSSEGHLLVYLHDNSESYYSDDDFSAKSVTFFQRQVIEPTAPLTQVTFENVPAGKYAVSVIHDEDDNGKLSRMVFPFVGMPSEPYGLSNNIYSSLSKGTFEEALIEITAPETQVSVTLATHLGKITGL